MCLLGGATVNYQNQIGGVVTNIGTPSLQN